MSPFELHCLFETQLSGRFMWPVSKDFCIMLLSDIAIDLFCRYYLFSLLVASGFRTLSQSFCF